MMLHSLHMGSMLRIWDYIYVSILKKKMVTITFLDILRPKYIPNADLHFLKRLKYK